MTSASLLWSRKRRAARAGLATGSPAHGIAGLLPHLLPFELIRQARSIGSRPSLHRRCDTAAWQVLPPEETTRHGGRPAQSHAAGFGSAD